jgi:hypothetical protein
MQVAVLELADMQYVAVENLGVFYLEIRDAIDYNATRIVFLSSCFSIKVGSV